MIIQPGVKTSVNFAEKISRGCRDTRLRASLVLSIHAQKPLFRRACSGHVRGRKEGVRPCVHLCFSLCRLFAGYLARLFTNAVVHPSQKHISPVCREDNNNKRTGPRPNLPKSPHIHILHSMGHSRTFSILKHGRPFFSYLQSHPTCCLQKSRCPRL